MLRLLPVLVGFLAVLASSSAADAQRFHQLEARLEGGSSSVRDDSLTPYAFTGPLLGLEARYFANLDRNLLEASLDVGAALVLTRAGDPGLRLHHGWAAGYARQLALPPSQALWLGSSLRFSHELAYLEAWDDAHGYWLDALMLGLLARYGLIVEGRHALEARLELGGVGVASRPPDRRLNKQDALTVPSYHLNRLGEAPRFTFLLETTELRAELLWRLRRASKRFGSGFGLGAESRLARTSFPQPYTSWYAGAIVSYGWTFP